MKPLIAAILLLIKIFPSFSQTEWTLKKEEDGIKILHRDSKDFHYVEVDSRSPNGVVFRR